MNLTQLTYLVLLNYPGIVKMLKTYYYNEIWYRMHHSFMQKEQGHVHTLNDTITTKWLGGTKKLTIFCFITNMYHHNWAETKYNTITNKITEFANKQIIAQIATEKVI